MFRIGVGGHSPGTPSRDDGQDQGPDPAHLPATECLDRRPPSPQAPGCLLAKVEQLEDAGLTANQRFTAQLLLVVQAYLLERSAPETFLTMSPGRIVRLVKSRNG